MIIDPEQSLKDILEKISNDPNICPKYKSALVTDHKLDKKITALKNEKFKLKLTLCNVCGQVHLIEGIK